MRTDRCDPESRKFRQRASSLSILPSKSLAFHRDTVPSRAPRHTTRPAITCPFVSRLRPGDLVGNGGTDRRTKVRENRVGQWSAGTERDVSSSYRDGVHEPPASRLSDAAQLFSMASDFSKIPRCEISEEIGLRTSASKKQVGTTMAAPPTRFRCTPHLDGGHPTADSKLTRPTPSHCRRRPFPSIPV